MLVKDKRLHNDLRDMVEKACEGVMPHVAEKIKDAARRAYYLGVLDGMKIEREEVA